MVARRSASFRAAVLFAVVALFTSCDAASRPDSPLAPPSADLVELQASSSPFRLITEPVLPPIDTRASAVIGIAGGEISIMGHKLTVPAGAVSVPTLFTVVVLPTPVIDVDLSATVSGLLGQAIDVGSFGFKKPVTLSLTYSRANNVTDPKKLFLVYFGDSGIEPLKSSVNTSAKTVSSQLHHFSRYGMASD